MNTWQFGDVRVDRVLEFEQPLLGWQQLLPAATSEAIDRQRAYLEPRWMEPGTGKLVMSFHSFLIRSHGLKILVDTCGGNDKPRPNKPRYHMQQWPYLDRLAAAGVSPEEIDFVLCTHLHVDHVGWNTRLVGGRWVPTFPKARYVFARREWDYWREHYKTEAFKDDPFYIDSVLPVIDAGQAQFVDSNFAFNDEVTLVPTPGHTPGHVCVNIRSKGAECVMTGDMMHHALQVGEPDWSSCFCVDPKQSSLSRRGLFERYAGTPTVILPAHFATPTAGTIERAGSTWRYRFQEG